MDNEVKDEIVIAVGVVADKVDNLERFFSKLKPLEAIIVVIQHMDARGKTLSIDELQSYTPIPVELITPETEISSGKIYLSPAHKLVSLHEGQFVIQEITDNNPKVATIDWFMNSISKYKERAIGVLLSEDGDDGSLGLKIIRENGGLTLAKEEETEHPVLVKKKKSPLDYIDHILKSEQMPKVLTSYLKILIKLDRKSSIAHLEDEIGIALKEICEILLEHTHHDFLHYKPSTMIRRIQRRMLVLQVDAVEEYVMILKREKKERDALFNDLLINVTSFFRDPDAFELVKEDVLKPELLKMEETKKYRIWVAGCSSGEEAYTMAILALEALEENNIRRDVQIIATDIDEEALATARKGEYPLSITDKVSKERIEKYFHRKDGKYVVLRKLRELILFSSHNLVTDPPFSQLDLISCRNVLIYLGPQLQKKLIPFFHYSLRPNGYLFLGISEVLGAHKDLFNPVSLKYRLAQRKALPIDHQSQHLLQSLRAGHKVPALDNGKTEEEDVHSIGQKVILDQFAPKFAVVGSEGQIISVSSGIQEYLEPSEGMFQNNIVKLVRQNLRSPVRGSLNECKKKQRLVESQPTIIKTPRGMIKVAVAVQSMPPTETHSDLFMVVFRDLGAVFENDEDGQSASNNDLTLVEELEKELARLREELDKTIQDLEASNEELKSSNEELLSMNEELQSVNEELEISKEEVQRGNETLYNSNIDLENLLNSTKIATIFLDDELNIKNFTPYINEIYDLRPQDIGRPIGSFNSKAEVMPVYKNPKNLAPDEVVETEVIMPDGRIFLRRKSAYLNQSKKKVGLVVTFVDVTALRQSEEMFRTLANSVPQMIWSTDHNGNYLYFSDQWFEFSGMDPATIKNKGFRDIIHPEDLEQSMKEWESAQKTRDYFSHEFRLKDKHGVYHWHLLRANSLRDRNGNIYRWFGTCTNIQEVKNQEFQLRASRLELIRNQERFNNVATAIDLGVWYCNLPFTTLNWSPTVRKHFWVHDTEDINIDTFYAKIHPEDREKVSIAIEKSINDKEFYDVSFRTVDSESNRFKWIRALGWTDYDDEGTPIRFDGVTLDVTEELRSFDALKDREWRYAMASKATRELIWDWDLMTNSLEWNESLVTEYGYESKLIQSSGQWWIDHIHPDDRERVQKSIHAVIDNRESHWSDEYRFRKADGTYAHVLDRGYLQINNKNEPIRMIGTMYDQTERNAYLMQMKEAIRARDEFLSIASHELKTPLTSMVLQMQILKRKMDRGQADMNGFIKANSLTLKQCQLLTSLIDDMLDVSRISNGKMNFSFKDASLKDIVTTAFEAFSANVEERKIPLKLEIENDSVIKADPFRLEQVIYNLLSNALKYGESKPIEVKVLQRKGTAVVEVRDYGMGISPENIERIFKLFERATSSTSISGLGLGLYISKQIVDAHKGAFEVESTLNEGSVFRVVIPIAQ